MTDINKPEEKKCECDQGNIEDWNGYHCRCGKVNTLQGTNQKCAVENCNICSASHPTQTSWEERFEKLGAYFRTHNDEVGHMEIHKFIADEIRITEERVRRETLEDITAEVQKLISSKNIEAFDNDGHRYQIPSSKREEWFKWCEIPSEDERSWDVPGFAERIDGMSVKSPQLSDVLELLSAGIKEK